MQSLSPARAETYDPRPLEETGSGGIASTQAGLDRVEELLRNQSTGGSYPEAALNAAIADLRGSLQALGRELESERKERRSAERDARSEAEAAQAARAALFTVKKEMKASVDKALTDVVNEAAAALWRNRHVLRTELKSVATLEPQLAGDGDALRVREDLLRNVLGSTSWKLTRPFRSVVGALQGRKEKRLELASLPSFLSGPPSSQDVTAAPTPPSSLEDERSAPTLAPAHVSQSTPPSFPLPGHVAALSELAETTGEVLDVCVSVIIPTLNAGAEFFWLLQKLRNQKGLREVEVVLVDSGSTDGTVELAAKMGCNVIPFDKADFSHSHTRNFGADHAKGDLLLFTVQDAYPVGDYWLHAMAKCLLHPASEAERLSAVSCAEFPRSDSELFYNALIDTHYRFLQCHDRDRVGRLVSEDSASIRMEGQLSDIACMVPRSIFMQYRYYGRYAEDLLFGIRLIRDGRRAGLLSSVRVIHSHHRSTGYHFRRVFVDVLFLREVFADFGVPLATSINGTMQAGYDLQAVLRGWSAKSFDTAPDAFKDLLQQLSERRPPRRMSALEGDGFGYAPMAAWVREHVARSGRVDCPLNAEEAQEWRRLQNSFVERIRHLKTYSDTVFTEMDARVAEEVQAAADKALSMSVGAHLAYIYMNAEISSDLGELAELRPMLLEGI